MAALVQAGLATGFKYMDWALEQRFPRPSSGSARPFNLNALQSFCPEVACAIYCGEQRLIPAGDFNLWFRIEPNPLQSRFVLDLRFGPNRPQTNISASFSAYDDFNLDHRTDRIGLRWQGTHGNVAPRGPLNFSRQLYQVVYHNGADRPAPPFVLVGVVPAAQLHFSWRTDACTRYGFGNRGGLSEDIVRAIDQFQAILDLAVQGGRLGVITKNSPRIPTLFWPWFCCQPVPSPESWWPWLEPLGVAESGAIMDFSSTLGFERDTGYINKALAVRRLGWSEPGVEDVNNTPQPLSLAKFKPVCRFTDHREYLAHILGSHGYEDLHARNSNQSNGRHWVDIYPEEGENMGHLLLLTVRAPNVLAGNALLEVGESATVFVTMDPRLGEETWAGTVVRIPTTFERHGSNLAIEITSTRPPIFGGRTLEPQRKLVQVSFESSGELCGEMRQQIIEVITGRDSFWKSWLLAQDNLSLDNTARTDDLPNGWQQQVDETCLHARLNAQQTRAVRTYFRCKATIVVGSPRTGKSTLMDVIMALETAFDNEFAHVKKSEGVLSACTAGARALFSRFEGAPHGLIVDNASKFMEANATYLILRAHSMGQLRRVLIIGDNPQLPLTLLAERNPFSASGSVSLIERQIRAGSSHVQLQTLYR